MIKPRLLPGALALAVGALVAPVGAQQAPRIDYHTFTLDNGLEVVVHEDHSTPIVAVNLWYDVGSAHEEEGRSGFAHLFEHMLFQETENLDKGQFMSMIPAAGGSFNGTTNEDRTAYFETLPSNRLNLALWAEAERMARLQVTAENFQREREVVKEERRLRIDNQPYGAAFLTVDTLATDYEPYKHTVIGSMDDLNAATVEDVTAFYRRYYVPNNATLVVAGDVELAEVRSLVEQYFGGIPRGPEMEPLPAPSTTPRVDGERRVVLPDDKANTPLVMMAYNIPPARHDDAYALDLLGSILSQGESSRLYRRLVQEEQAALQAGGGPDSRVGPGLFTFFALPNQDVSPERIEALIEDELRKIREDGVPARELQKAQNQARANTIMSRQSVFSKASQLQSARLYQGDMEAVNTDLARYAEVTVEDIQRVARMYLVPTNRTVVIAVPAEEAPADADEQTT